MAPKQYENILLLRMLHIPFRQKRIAIIRGQSIGIPTKSAIWLSAFSRSSSGSAEYSLATIVATAAAEKSSSIGQFSYFMVQ